MYSVILVLLVAPLLQAYRLYATPTKVSLIKYSYYYYAEIRTEREYKWYTYEGGRKVEAVGCEITPGFGLLYGQTFRHGEFVYECQRGTEYQSRIVPVACFFMGKEMNPGGKVPYRHFLYSCTQKEKLLVFEAVACLDDRGEQHSVGMKLTRGDVKYECTPQGNQLIQKAVGCNIGGKEVDVHKSAAIGNLWYKCARAGIGGVEVQVMGCVSEEGKRVDIGRTFRKGGYVYKCKARGSRVGIELAGCVGLEMGQFKDFTFGAHWYTRPVGIMGYMMECVGNERQAAQEISHCVVNEHHGRRTTAVGCGTPYGYDKMLICKRLRDGNVQGSLITLEKGKSLFDSIAAQGVRNC